MRQGTPSGTFWDGQITLRGFDAQRVRRQDAYATFCARALRLVSGISLTRIGARHPFRLSPRGLLPEASILLPPATRQTRTDFLDDRQS